MGRSMIVVLIVVMGMISLLMFIGVKKGYIPYKTGVISTTWQYMLIDVTNSNAPLMDRSTSVRSAEKKINKLGEKGWELVAFDGQLIIFKKKK